MLPNQLKVAAILLVGACASLNLLLGFTAVGRTEKRDHDEWLRASIKLDGPPAVSTADDAAGASREVDTEHSFTRLGPPRRFPSYGTPEFGETCSWTFEAAPQRRNCTFLARPPPREKEGIASFFAKIVAGRILARQAGCTIMFDYGADFDISSALAPFPPNQDPMDPSIDWRVPPEKKRPEWCKEDAQCFDAKESYSNKSILRQIEHALGAGKFLSAPPYYRFAYKAASKLVKSDFKNLTQAIPGFEVETGMACSLGSLLYLPPTISQFEPELFSKILPTLHSEDALVISLYIRTALTDVVAMAEKEGENTTNLGLTIEKHNERHQAGILALTKCALQIEKEKLKQGGFSRVVWVVLSDSPYAKKWVMETYDTHGSNHQSEVSVHREVLTTHSRGAHTRAQRGPSIADFAEALIDWYLIGEADLVVMDGQSPSFGETAALRTARPVYKAPKCFRQVLVHEKKTDANAKIARKK